MNVSRVLLLAALVAAFLLPGSVYGQETSADLRATIRSGLLSDPRTSGLSEVQIDTLVGLLADEAEKQGITSQDIQWRPQNAEQFVAVEGTATEEVACAGGLLCIMSEAFGFIGYDVTIPFFLGMSSMGLIWILAEMIHRHRHPVIKVSAPPTTSSL